jgi:hypothetical protein
LAPKLLPLALAPKASFIWEGVSRAFSVLQCARITVQGERILILDRARLAAEFMRDLLIDGPENDLHVHNELVV